MRGRHRESALELCSKPAQTLKKAALGPFPAKETANLSDADPLARAPHPPPHTQEKCPARGKRRLRRGRATGRRAMVRTHHHHHEQGTWMGRVRHNPEAQCDTTPRRSATPVSPPSHPPTLFPHPSHPLSPPRLLQGGPWSRGRGQDHRRKPFVFFTFSPSHAYANLTTPVCIDNSCASTR